MSTYTRAISTLLIAMPIASACAAGDCQHERFEGASQPQGAETHMTVVNRGTPCRIANYGVPATPNENPAYSGEVTVMPQHGVAVFEPPRASYTPAADFVGEDSFAYSAFAKDRAGRSIRLRVKVNVTVVAP